jgi:ubiquinone/menaquinone biosynthesis C-methylase UbiE
LADPAWPRLVADARWLPLRAARLDVAVLAFMLFHVPDPLAALREVGRVLRDAGVIGVATWGSTVESGAARCWDEMLDQYGAAAADSLLSLHHVMDTPAKVTNLVEAAGLHHTRTVVLPWSFQPTPEEFAQRCLSMGLRARRLASLTGAAQVEFRQHVRHRLDGLDDHAFVERGEVLLTLGRK